VAAAHIAGTAGGKIRAPDMACRAVATTLACRGGRRGLARGTGGGGGGVWRGVVGDASVIFPRWRARHGQQGRGARVAVCAPPAWTGAADQAGE
jgi:hypothetical protein